MSGAAGLTLIRGLNSPPSSAHQQGAPVQALDIIERLLQSAQHPDIVSVARYGPNLGPWGPTVAQSRVKAISGVKVVHPSTATASVWEAVWPAGQPVDPPAVLPGPRQNRAPRLLILLQQLLDVAKPDTLTSWQLVALPGLGDPQTQAGLPTGLAIVTATGDRVLLRATATGPVVGADPDVDPFVDYRIPEEVKTCLQQASAASAGS